MFPLRLFIIFTSCTGHFDTWAYPVSLKIETFCIASIPISRAKIDPWSFSGWGFFLTTSGNPFPRTLGSYFGILNRPCGSSLWNIALRVPSIFLSTWFSDTLLRKFFPGLLRNFWPISPFYTHFLLRRVSRLLKLFSRFLRYPAASCEYPALFSDIWSGTTRKFVACNSLSRPEDSSWNFIMVPGNIYDHRPETRYEYPRTSL